VRDRGQGQCLADDTLTEYLEGALEPVIKAATEAHLIACEECRSQLAGFMRVLQEDITPEEVNTLETVATEWDRRTGNNRLRQRKFIFPRSFLAIASIAAVFVLAVVSLWLFSGPSEPRSSAELIQVLLDQNRPFESRIAGQSHRLMIRTRGSDDPGVSYSLLAGELTKFSANGHEMGKFYLLQKDFARAIPYLEIAAGEVGAGAAVHNDLGVAYLESGNASQLEKAGTEFLQALEQDKTFATAAFNLAVFYERTNAIAQAEAQWKQYLELDSESDWAVEARERLEGLSR
jgi:tetratricopeptide (TPR) repeat protein